MDAFSIIGDVLPWIVVVFVIKELTDMNGN